MKRKLTANKYFVPIIFILLVNIIVWKDSVYYRSPWMGEINESGELHTWLTGSTVKFAANWLEEDVLQSRFRMYENPISVEFQSNEDRLLYQSYPSGCVIPVYILAKVTGTNSTHGIIKLTMLWNLLNQFLIEICMCLIVFLFLYKTLPLLHTTMFSLLPITVYFCAASLWFHQNVYFSDQGVIVFFALALVGEFLRDELIEKKQYKKSIIAIDVLLFFINFAGCFTDWFFFFFMFVIFIKRLCTKDFSDKFNIIFLLKAFLYCIPVFLTIILFIMQIDSLETLMNTFLYRAGFTETTSVRDLTPTTLKKFLTTTMWKYLILDYGIVGMLMINASICIWIFMIIFKRKTSGRFIRYYTLIFVPCIFQMTVLKNHSVVHEFSALKLEILLGFLCSTLPVICIPNKFFDKITLPAFIPAKNTQIFIPILPVLFFLLFSGCFSIQRFVPRIPDTDYKQNYSNEMFLRESTGFNDIVFSFTDDIPFNPPQQLAYSRKRVYKISNFDDITNYFENHTITEPYNVLLFDTQNNFALTKNQKLEVYKQDTKKERSITLYKVLDY